MSPLSLEVMGLVALGVMWINTMLILATIGSDALRAYRAAPGAPAVFVAIAGGTAIAAAAVGVTALALSQPYFGPASTAGGALGLAYFLLVQPAGVVLREHITAPSARTARDGRHPRG